ncbi:carotenoid oxygenase [Hyaloraphidium curvatum]|nr:carotenoid oxygenase [Hyaloraphidium curvatum]
MRCGPLPPPFLPALRNTPEVTAPVRLAVQGTLPPWLSGVLYRAGPGTYEIPLSPEAAKRTGKETYRISHWFDGLSMIHRFEIAPGGEVTYRSRSTAKGVEELIRAEGGTLLSFGQDPDPCVSLLGRFMTFFSTGRRAYAARGDPPAARPDGRNIGVTISPDYPVPGGPGSAPEKRGVPRTLVVKTDQNALQTLDPVTLEPLGTYGYEDLNPDVAKGPLSAAHAQVDPRTGERVNFTMSLGPSPKMSILSTTLDDPRGRILATFTPPATTYIHSFAMTDRFVVVPFWPYHFGTGMGILWHQNLLDALTWEPSRSTVFVFISRKHHRVVALYSAPPAFCFHTISAHDAANGDLVLDLVGHPDASLVRATRLRSIELGEPRAGDVRRYVFPDPGRFDLAGSGPPARVKERVVPRILHPEAGVELPRVNPEYAGKEGLTWVYALAEREDEDGRRLMFAGIKKLSLKEPHTATMWSEPGLYAGEPVFVPRPGATDEDDGVLLTVAFDAARTSSALVVLDARTMRETARCVFGGEGHVVGFGFHGAFHGMGDNEY